MEESAWTEEVIKRFENFVESKKENSSWYFRLIKQLEEFKASLKPLSV